MLELGHHWPGRPPRRRSLLGLGGGGAPEREEVEERAGPRLGAGLRGGRGPHVGPAGRAERFAERVELLLRRVGGGRLLCPVSA